jgi:hypothetical protein
VADDADVPRPLQGLLADEPGSPTADLVPVEAAIGVILKNGEKSEEVGAVIYLGKAEYTRYMRDDFVQQKALMERLGLLLKT